MATTRQTTRQSLQQIVKDANGQVEQAPDKGQAQTQAAALGQPSTPSTPLGAAGNGQTPDSAKMAGTPAAQQGAAAFTATVPQPNVAPPAQPTVTKEAPQASTARKLADVLMQQDLQPQVDPAEQQRQAQKAQDAQRLQARFGDIGSRVSDMISSASDALFAPVPAAGAAPGGETTMALTDAGKGLPADLSQQVLQAAQGPLSTQKIKDLADAIGKATGLTPESVDISKYVSGLDPGTTIAAATQRSLTVNDQTAADLGFKDVGDIATQLGVPVDQIQGKSLAQLTSLARSQLATKFGDVASAKAAVQDPLLGPNERRAARQTLAAAGADGALATDQHMAKLSDELDRADTITFNGQEMSVEDMLSSDHMTSLATQWADSPPGSAFREQLSKTEPAFAAWLDKHEAFVQDAATQLGSSLDKFKDLQAGNQKAVQDAASATGVSTYQVNQMLTSMGLPYGFSADPVTVPSMLTDLSSKGKAAGLDPATAAAQFASHAGDPAALHAIQSIVDDPKQGWAALAKMGFGSKDPAKAKAAEVALGRRSSVPTGAAAKDPAALAKYVFGDTSDEEGGMSATALQQQVISNLSAAKKAGLPLTAQQKSLQSILDADGDGKIDDPTKVGPRLQAAVAAGQFDTKLDPNKMVANFGKFGPMAITLQKTGTVTPANLRSSLSSYLSMTDDQFQEEKQALLSLPKGSSLKDTITDIEKQRQDAHDAQKEKERQEQRRKDEIAAASAAAIAANKEKTKKAMEKEAADKMKKKAGGGTKALSDLLPGRPKDLNPVEAPVAKGKGFLEKL